MQIDYFRTTCRSIAQSLNVHSTEQLVWRTACPKYPCFSLAIYYLASLSFEFYRIGLRSQSTQYTSPHILCFHNTICLPKNSRTISPKTANPVGLVQSLAFCLSSQHCKCQNFEMPRKPPEINVILIIQMANTDTVYST